MDLNTLPLPLPEIREQIPKEPDNTPRGPTTPNGPGKAEPLRQSYNKFKYEVADEMDLPRISGLGGTVSQPGYVGAFTVKKIIEAQERQMNYQGK